MGQFSLHEGERRGMGDSRLHTSFPGFSFLLPGMSLCRDELERTLKTRLKRLERVHSFFYKNAVFPAQAEYSYFSADFRLKIFLYYS